MLQYLSVRRNTIASGVAHRANQQRMMNNPDHRESLQVTDEQC
jgi:hypothetical protein